MEYQKLKREFKLPNNVLNAKKIASQFSRELGFVNRNALVESNERKELYVVGRKAFCHFHHRRDGQTTIYSLAVSKKWQNLKFGKMLVERLIVESKKKGQRVLVAKCPKDLPSNDFYKHLGFKLCRVEMGRKRKLYVWRLFIN